MLPFSTTTALELSESNSNVWQQRSDELEGEESEWKFVSKQQLQGMHGKETEEHFIGCEESWFPGTANIGAGFTGMLLDGSNMHDTSECWDESSNGQDEQRSQVSEDAENKNYWNGIFSMVNSEQPPLQPPLL